MPWINMAFNMSWIVVSLPPATLALEANVENAAWWIWARSNWFWENLIATQSKGLRGYGPLPADFAEYLDSRMETLIHNLNCIVGIVSRRPDSFSDRADDTPDRGESKDEKHE